MLTNLTVSVANLVLFGQINNNLWRIVEAARRIQAERFAPLNKPHVLVNGDIGSPWARPKCRCFANWMKPAKILCAPPCNR